MKIYINIKELLICFTLTSSLLASGCVTLSGGGIVVGDDDSQVAVIFTNRDRSLIDDYFSRGRKHKRTPPGLAKRSKLPPGLQRQLERNGKLPPGLQGRGLPGDLESSLSRLPGGYVRLIVGADVVLMNKKTRVVVDIIKGIAG